MCGSGRKLPGTAGGVQVIVAAIVTDYCIDVILRRLQPCVAQIVRAHGSAACINLTTDLYGLGYPSQPLGTAVARSRN